MWPRKAALALSVVLKWPPTRHCLLNSQFYRNSSFVVRVILNNVFRRVVPWWHLLTSSPGKHVRAYESLISARKGQEILISLCKRVLYCQNPTPLSWRQNIFRPFRDSLSDSISVMPFKSWNVEITSTISRLQKVKIDFTRGNERTRAISCCMLVVHPRCVKRALWGGDFFGGEGLKSAAARLEIHRLLCGSLLFLEHLGNLDLKVRPAETRLSDFVCRCSWAKWQIHRLG